MRIGHPTGTLQLEIEIEEQDDRLDLLAKAALARTARLLMDGSLRPRTAPRVESLRCNNAAENHAVAAIERREEFYFSPAEFTPRLHRHAIPAAQ